MLPIVACTVAAFALAVAWYSPATFGAPWATLTRRYTGLTDAELGADIPRKATLWALGFAIHAVALGWLLDATHATTLAETLPVGLVSSLGFGLPLASWPAVHARQPPGIWAMNAGLHLAQTLAMCAIFAAAL